MFAESVLAERPWSNSKVETLDKCPRAYCLKYRDKVKGAKSGPEARIGTTLHNVFEYSLRTEMPDEDKLLAGQELADPMAVPVPCHTAADLDERLPYLLDIFSRSPRNALVGDEIDRASNLLPRIKSFVLGMQGLAETRGVETFFLEHRTAINVEYGLTAFDDPEALIRGVVDFGFIADSIYVVIDHKTGKPKDLIQYADQLRLYMLFALAEHPDVEGVQCGINHVQRPKVDWSPPRTRNEIEREVMPWLGHHLNRLDVKLQMIDAGRRHAKVGPLCNWCDFVNGPGLCPEGLDEVTARPRGPRLLLPLVQTPT